MRRLGELAAALGARLADGASPEAPVRGLVTPEEASPGHLCFLRASWRGAPPPGGWVLAEEGGWSGPATLRVASLDAILPELLDLFWEDPDSWGEPLVRWGQGEAAPSARLASDVVLQPGARVGRLAELGPGCVIGANAVIEGGAKLGAGCVVAAGEVGGRIATTTSRRSRRPADRFHDVAVLSTER